MSDFSRVFRREFTTTRTHIPSTKGGRPSLLPLFSGTCPLPNETTSERGTRGSDRRMKGLVSKTEGPSETVLSQDSFSTPLPPPPPTRPYPTLKEGAPHPKRRCTTPVWSPETRMDGPPDLKWNTERTFLPPVLSSTRPLPFVSCSLQFPKQVLCIQGPSENRG